MRKNNFSFVTWAAAASLGLGLMASGCGDSGSTSPNPLGGDTTSKVVFDYSVLAKELSAKTEIPVNIASVKYVFRGQHEDKQTFVDSSEDYTYKFTHKGEAYDQEVVIEGVDLDSTEVTAAYYDESDELVAVGVDKLDWDETTKNARVEKPTVQIIDENSAVNFTASQYIISKDGQTAFSLMVTPSEEGAEPVDMLSLATLSGIDETVLTLAENTQPGVYKAVKYGQLENVTAKITSKIEVKLPRTIYVTDQQPTALVIVPQPVEGKEVAVEEATSEDPRTLDMLYADESKYVSFGYKVIHFPARYSGETDIDVAVNEQPIKVFTAAYTNTSDKGPQPDLGVDITDDNKLTFETKHLVDTPDKDDLNRLSAKDGALYLDGLNKKNNYFQVTAKFDDGSAEGLTDTLRVRAQGAVPYTQFFDTESSKLLSALAFDEPKTYHLKIVGNVFAFGRDSVALDIPEDMIPADQYPEVAPLEPATDNVKYSQVETGKNGYVVEWLERLEETTKVAVKRPDNAKWPEFFSLWLMRH